MVEKNENYATKLLTGLRNIWPAQAAGSDPELNYSLLRDPLFLNFVNSSPAGISIFSYDTISYEYFSPNLLEMLGESADKLEGISGAEFTVNSFHPEHLPLMFKMMEHVKKYYYKYSLEKRIMDTRFTWVMKLKGANGQYFWTLQHTVLLQQNQEGFPLRVLIFVSDISDVKTNEKVDFVFSLKNQNGDGYETIYAAHYEPSAEYVLTEREIAVLNCVSKGMTNQEIADKLSISKNTVITHRKNIMKKSGKDNIIQLLTD